MGLGVHNSEWHGGERVRQGRFVFSLRAEVDQLAS